MLRRHYLQKVSPRLHRPRPTGQHDDFLPPGGHEGREHPWRGTIAILRSPHPVHCRCGLRLPIVTTAILAANFLLLLLSLLLLLLLMLPVFPPPAPLATPFVSTALLCRSGCLAGTTRNDSGAAARVSNRMCVCSDDRKHSLKSACLKFGSSERVTFGCR